MRLQAGSGFSISGRDKDFAGTLFRLADRHHHLLVLVPNLEARAPLIVNLKKRTGASLVVVQVDAGIAFLGFEQDWHFVAAMPDRDNLGIEKQKRRAWLLRQLLFLADHSQNMIEISPKPRHLSSQLIKFV